MNSFYCHNLLSYKRRSTNIVNIGGIPMGENYPIRLQSMTNTSTSDTIATVNQILKIAEKGADYVRLTVQGKKEAENLSDIVAELSERQCAIPLIADIHFNPGLALKAASVVDKVRINPGNYIDRKKSNSIDYTEEEYIAEIERIKEQLQALIAICREMNTALRIGTNHGSLSDRIMSRYGDTPEGMAESVMEFLRICQEAEFYDVVVSMKASNTRIMVYATRLLVQKMEEEGMSFPVHLGVTEAGEGEDGRIKSAVGIGTLLADGIGETIRVSLTEDPDIEIPVARKMIDYLQLRNDHKPIPPFGDYPINPYSYRKRGSIVFGNMGGKNAPVVILSIKETVNLKTLSEIGWNYKEDQGWYFTDLAPDYLFVSQWPAELKLPTQKYVIVPVENYSASNGIAGRLLSFDQYTDQDKNFSGINFICITAALLQTEVIKILRKLNNTVLVLETDNANGFADQRSALFRLINQHCNLPVILKHHYNESLDEDLQLKSAMDLGGLFIDGLGDGIWLENSGDIDNATVVSTSFGILQASRVRVTRTEYISCPSCGRTLFDLQTTTKKIRERTSHLKGLKIGIMGCIVNGPGEMADADYGYVGAGKGRVTLYKEKTIVQKNVPENEAVDALIRLIKENNDWTDPETP